jgi:hypothetical protein
MPHPETSHLFRWFLVWRAAIIKKHARIQGLFALLVGFTGSYATIQESAICSAGSRCGVQDLAKEAPTSKVLLLASLIYGLLCHRLSGGIKDFSTKTSHHTGTDFPGKLRKQSSNSYSSSDF